MLDAICKIDENNQQVFSIFEFKGFSDSEIDRLRYSLLCPVCKQKAYFRRASKDGKQACFGSRYHDVDCDEFNPSARKSEEEKQAAEVEKILVEADSLLIDFSLPISVKRVANKQESNNQVHTSDSSTANSPSLANKENELNINKQGLKKLLVSLIRGSSLAHSDVWVYTSEKHKWRAKNLFVNINQATPTDNGAPRMYWGTISHADKALNWLNPAEERSVAIPISKYKDAFLKRFNVSESRDLEGASFIVFAKCVESKDKKRKFLQLWNNDVQYFYLSKAEE